MMRLLFVFSLFVVPLLADVLTESAKKVTLDNHNAHRQSLADGKEKNKDGQTMPPASNMKMLKYSPDLEQKAQEWAKECKFAHTPNIKYGQNLYYHSADQSQEEALVRAGNAWWNELPQLYPGTSVVLTFDLFKTGIGHFTQMAWADTESVGCAVQKCSFGTLVVCNYNTGNIMKRKIYEPGTCARTSGAA